MTHPAVTTTSNNWPLPIYINKVATQLAQKKQRVRLVMRQRHVARLTNLLVNRTMN